jgi:CHRD domain
MYLISTSQYTYIELLYTRRLMDTKRILRFSSIVAVVACAAISAADLSTSNLIPIALAQLQQKFMAKLTGQNEVPEKNTNATGTFVLHLTADGRISKYIFNLTNINNMTLVHIHQGGKGINGPIVVTLYKSANPRGPINGTLSEGKIFSNQFEGPLTGKYISDLMKLINEGKVYVNVHTKQNPQGEIRGQLSNVTS